MKNNNFLDSLSKSLIDDVRKMMKTKDSHVEEVKNEPVEEAYNKTAVDAAIASSNRSGRKIGGKEAKLIHALLKGSSGRKPKWTKDESDAHVKMVKKMNTDSVKEDTDQYQKPKSTETKVVQNKQKPYRPIKLNTPTVKHPSGADGNRLRFEAKEDSPIAGTRLISKHEGKDGHHAEVRYNKDWEEYSVHHYNNGKHMGEGPVSYHGSGKDGKKDAADTAEYEVKNFRPKGNSLSQVKEAVEHDMESPISFSDEELKFFKENGLDIEENYGDKRDYSR